MEINGQEVQTIKTPQSPPFPEAPEGEDLIWVWDASAGQLKHCRIDQLPFGEGGGGGTMAVLPAQIILDPGAEQISVVDGNTVIADVRLVGYTNYIIRTTQLNNAAFRLDEVAYDATAGTVTIFDFVLEDMQRIIIDAPGVRPGSSSTGNLQNLIDRITMLEALTAPYRPTAFGPTKAYTWWEGPLEEIPAGWQIVSGWAGRVPVVLDTTDDDFKTIGKTGGAKDYKLAISNLPELQFFTVYNAEVSTPDFPSQSGRDLSPTRSMIKRWDKTNGGGKESYVLYGTASEGQLPNMSPTNKLGKADPDAVKTTMKYRTGVWIKFVGV